MKKKGSITVFLCLFLAIFIGIVQIFFYAVQIAGGRVQAIAGVQEGLYSVFAGYDRELLEKYHLFFVDGTYNTAHLNMGEAYHRVRQQVERSCSPQIINLGIRGENFWNCYFERGEITGYTLATDKNGASFKKQAIEYMEDTLGNQGVQLLLEQMQTEGKWSITEDGNLYLEKGKNAQESYELEVQEDSGSEKDSPSEIPKNFINPLEVVKEIRKKGILSLVMPFSAKVSQISVNLNEMPSKRKNEMGIIVGTGEQDATDVVGTLLFREYIMTHLNCYTDSIDNAGLAYELEYVLGGKSSDIENLKSVVTKLIGIREASNMAYLMTDSLRQAELHQMALMICTVLGMPAIEAVVRLALAAAWSYGESLLDVRNLLSGGKIPFVKTKDTWMLSIEGLCNLTQILKENSKTTQKGMSYEEYLRVLLGLQKEEQQVNRTIDVVENTIRAIKGKEKFRMDYCFSYMEVLMYVNCNGLEYEILRDYGY